MGLRLSDWANMYMRAARMARQHHPLLVLAVETLNTVDCSVKPCPRWSTQKLFSFYYK